MLTLVAGPCWFWSVGPQSSSGSAVSGGVAGGGRGRHLSDLNWLWEDEAGRPLSRPLADADRTPEHTDFN